MSHTLLERDSDVQPLAAMTSFVHRQVRNARMHARFDRRSETRSPLVVHVTARPVDDRFEPIGQPFSLVSRDLSPQGIGLVHDKPVAHELLALQWFIGEEEVNVVVRLRWFRHLGPFYYLGGDFVAKLDRFPETSAAMDCETSRS